MAQQSYAKKAMARLEKDRRNVPNPPPATPLVDALTDDEAEAAFVALVDVLDGLACCPVVTVASKEDEGVSFSLHFRADRARKLAALQSQPSNEARLREALEKSDGIASGPNGDGGMRLTITFPEPGTEMDLFELLTAALSNEENGSERYVGDSLHDIAFEQRRDAEGNG